MAELSDIRLYLLVNSGNIFDKELENDDWLMQVVYKALMFYNNYAPAVKEEIVSIMGGDPLFAGGQPYFFTAPYPKWCSAYPVSVGVNFFDGLATPPFSYNSALGELRVNSSGFYRIKYSVDLTLDDITQADHPLFFLMLEAQYKMVLGGMRQRFTITDTQFTTDNSLHAEGVAQMEEAKKMLEENAPIWVALGGR
jgi:hypothetical protein